MGEDISDLENLISSNEDALMNSRDLAFFLVTHNFNAVPKDGYVELDLNGTIYTLIPNSEKPGLCDIKYWIGNKDGYIMNSKRRTNDLIVSQILKVCAHGVSKTKIVYQANMNFITVRPYLDNLMKSGCIEAVHEGSRTLYKTTPKGMELKERFERFQSEISEIYACVWISEAPTSQEFGYKSELPIYPACPLVHSSLTRQDRWGYCPVHHLLGISAPFLHRSLNMPLLDGL
jgi:predicted transcriptional regulator